MPGKRKSERRKTVYIKKSLHHKLKILAAQYDVQLHVLVETGLTALLETGSWPELGSDVDFLIETQHKSPEKGEFNVSA